MALVWQDTGMKKIVTNQKYIDSEIFKTISIINTITMFKSFKYTFQYCKKNLIKILIFVLLTLSNESQLSNLKQKLM